MAKELVPGLLEATRVIEKANAQFVEFNANAVDDFYCALLDLNRNVGNKSQYPTWAHWIADFIPYRFNNSTLVILTQWVRELNTEIGERPIDCADFLHGVICHAVDVSYRAREPQFSVKGFLQTLPWFRIDGEKVVADGDALSALLIERVDANLLESAKEWDKFRHKAIGWSKALLMMEREIEIHEVCMPRFVGWYRETLGHLPKLAERPDVEGVI